MKGEKGLDTSQNHGQTKDMIGIKRNIASKAHLMLGMFPVVALLGARQVGKTTLAKILMPTGKYIDLENPDDFDLLTPC